LKGRAMKRTRRVDMTALAEQLIGMAKEAGNGNMRDSAEAMVADFAGSAGVPADELWRAVTRRLDLERIMAAIRDGRCFLQTYCGKRRVRSYRDDTGWAVTNNTDDPYHQQSFMVSLSDFVIEPPVRGAER